MKDIIALFRYYGVSDSDITTLRDIDKLIRLDGSMKTAPWFAKSCAFSEQPLLSGDRSVALVCDEGVGCNPAQIIALYQQYGINCLSKLQGVFAFCLYDVSKGLLLVARDRIGEKSMYFSQLTTGCVFSSQLHHILQHFIKKPVIHEKVLAEAIRFNFPINLRQTWIGQIFRLKAGEFAVVDKDGIMIQSYWKRDHTPSFEGSKENAIDKAKLLMQTSVEQCMAGDQPVVVLLSGGIDSCSIAAFAKECKGEVHVLSAGYKGLYSCDERPAARRFAKEKGLTYHEVELDVDDFQDIFEELIPFLDEPCFDVSSMSQFALYKKAAEMGYKVILSGLGGDEQFYSYAVNNQYVEALKSRKQHQNLFPCKGKKKELIRYLLTHWKEVICAGYPNKIDESFPTRWTYDDYVKFSEKAVIDYPYGHIDFSEIDVHHSFAENTDINSMYDFLFSTFMTTLCVYLGRKLCAANGVEIRFPLLDYHLVEFLDSVPLEMKYNIQAPKQFQKEIMDGILPDYILYAPKRGFTPPIDYIHRMNSSYHYHTMRAEHVFFNSMMADKIVTNLLVK